jgi:hypothetical protein
MTTTAIGTVIAAFTNHQVISLVRRNVSKIILERISSIMIVTRRTSKAIPFVSHAILKLIRGTRRSFTFSNPTTVRLTVIKIGRVIAAFSINQTLVLRRSIFKALVYLSTTVLLAKLGKQIEKPAFNIKNHSILNLIRTGGRVFPLYNSTAVNLSLRKVVRRLLIVTQGQRLKFIIPYMTLKLTQAQNLAVTSVVPGRVMVRIIQSQHFAISRIIVSKIANIKTLVATTLLRTRSFNRAFALASSSLITLRQRIRKTVPLIRSPSSLSISRNVRRLKVIGLLSKSVLSIFYSDKNRLLIHLSTSQLIRTKKIVSKLIRLSTRVRLVIKKAFGQVLGYHQLETLKVTAGKTWRLVVSFAIRSTVAVAITKRLTVTMNLIQSSIITVYTKVRMLIQKAIILLVGA